MYTINKGHRSRASAVVLAVLLAVTSVLFDFPIRSSVETGAATNSFTIYTNGNNVGKVYWGSISQKDNGNSFGKTNNYANGSTITKSNNRLIAFSEKGYSDAGYSVKVFSDNPSDATNKFPANIADQSGWWNKTTEVAAFKRIDNQLNTNNYPDISNILLQFVPNTPTFTVNYAHTEGGKIKVANGSIEVDTFANYESADLGSTTYIDVTAVADDGYAFIGWLTNDGTSRKTGNETIDASKAKEAGNGGTVTASFAKKYNITYSFDNGGTSATLSGGSGDYYAPWSKKDDYTLKQLTGASVDNTGINTTIYEIEWKKRGDDTVLGTDWSFTPTVDNINTNSDTEFVATVKLKDGLNKIEYTAENGKINGGTSFTDYYSDYNYAAEITPTPNAGYYFLWWANGTDGTADVVQVGDSTFKPTEEQLETSRTYKAVFTRANRIILSVNNSAMGDIKVGRSFGYVGKAQQVGDSQLTDTNVERRIIAVPSNTDYTFDHWKINGVDITTEDGKNPTLSANIVEYTNYNNHICYAEAVFVGASTVNVKNQSEGYGKVTYVNGDNTKEIPESDRLTFTGAYSGTLTAEATHQYMEFYKWTLTDSAGNQIETYTNNVLDLSAISSNLSSGCTLSAYYKAKDGYTIIRYEAYDTKNTINFPPELTVGSESVANQGRNVTKAPYILEVVPDGAEATGCLAKTLGDGKMPYADNFTYRVFGWRQENDYLITEEAFFKPEGQKYLGDYIGDTGDNIITYYADCRQTKNYYVLYEYSVNVDETAYNIINGKRISGVPDGTVLTNTFFYVGYCDYDSDGNIIDRHPIMNATEAIKDSNFHQPFVQVPPGYEFQYWELRTGNGDEVLSSVPNSTGYSQWVEIIKSKATQYINSDDGTKTHIIRLVAVIKEIPCTVTVTKTIDEKPAGFGNPAFVFKLEGMEYTNYTELDFTKSVSEWTEKDGKYTATVTFTVPRGEYTVSEVDTLRYNEKSFKLEVASDDTTDGKTVTSGRTVTFNQGGGKAAAVFENELSNHGKRSYSDSKVNHIGS